MSGLRIFKFQVGSYAPENISKKVSSPPDDSKSKHCGVKDFYGTLIRASEFSKKLQAEATTGGVL